jgi:hypothetical protein
MGPPAGGPEDKVPPKLVGTVPDSIGSYPGWKRDVEFLFDEIVSEGSTPNQGLGTGDLEKLILLSPTRAVPVIKWKRDRITVHPKEGWRPNRVYRVELLPGLLDLRRNRTDTAAVLTFSTGGPAPTDTIEGIAIDWVQGRAARAALIELVLQPDSLVYRTLTDSGGRYAIGPLPRGRWTVFGALDQNRNLRFDRRESHDSAGVAEGARRVPPLWLIPRDTVGPRILSITATDSVSATVAMSQPLDPYQRMDSVAVRFMLQKDSTPVPFASLLHKTVDDSLQRIIKARDDSARAAADTSRKEAAGKAPAQPFRDRPEAESVRADPEVDSLLATRPRLADKLVLRVATPFTPEAKYLLELRGIRSAAGVAGEAKAVLAIPKRAQPKAETPDTTAAPLDSLRLPPTKPAPAPR